MKQFGYYILATIALLGIFTGVAFAATLQGFQGGTGIATSTSGSDTYCLKQASSSPFLTWTLGPCATGGGTTTINGVAATIFQLIGSGAITSTVNGTTTTFSFINPGFLSNASITANSPIGWSTTNTIYFIGSYVSTNTGNWAGTWQGLNSSSVAAETTYQSSTLHIEGDSICREVLGGVSGTYKEWYEYITIPKYHNDSWNRTTHCVGGTTMNTMYTNRATYIDPNLINGGNNILVIAGQGNDLYFGASTSTFEATALAFGQAEQAAGWKVVFVNMFDRNDGTITRAQIDDYNAWTRKTWPQFADVLVDLGMDPILGPSGASNNTTYFDADKIHLTDRGLAYYAKQVQAGILKAQNKLALGSLLASTTMGTTTFPNLTPNSFAFIGPDGKLTTTSTPTGSGSSSPATVNLTGSSTANYFTYWLDTLGNISATSVISVNRASVGASTTVSTTQTFSYTGAMASFTLPDTVTGSVTFYVRGGGGGKGGNGDDGSSYGGYGGAATGTLSAASSTPGLVLWVAVGGSGVDASGTSATTTGGWPGGGNGSPGGLGAGFSGGSGGGLSGIFNTSTIASSTAYIVAGAGGGGTCYGNNQGYGDGGGLTGGDGSNGSGTVGGKKGTQSAGGAGGTSPLGSGTGATGTSMTGGNAGAKGSSGCGGGGGGAGYWGGGGAASFNNGSSGGGAGGGSSFMLSSLTATSSASSTANTATGTVKITYSYVTSSPAVVSNYVGIGLDAITQTSTLTVSGTMSVWGVASFLNNLQVFGSLTDAGGNKYVTSTTGGVSSVQSSTDISVSAATGSNIQFTLKNTYSTTTPANPTASIGTTAVNGTANTFMRSDAAPKLGSQFASNTPTFAFFDASTTASLAGYMYLKKYFDATSTLSFVQCNEYAAATTTLELVRVTSLATTTASTAYLTSIACGINGTTTATFATNTIPAQTWIMARVTSTLGTPVHTDLFMSYTVN